MEQYARTQPAESQQARAARQPGSVQVLHSESRVLLVLTGEAAASMDAQMVEAVHDVADRDLPIDLETRQVTFIDSSAIALLVYLAHRVPHPMRFIQPSEPVRFLMDITQLDEQAEVLDHDPGFDGA